jgi:hypothetical protein
VRQAGSTHRHAQKRRAAAAAAARAPTQAERARAREVGAGRGGGAVGEPTDYVCGCQHSASLLLQPDAHSVHSTGASRGLTT